MFGQILWYNKPKGFGFITDEAKEELRYFFHIRDNKSILESDLVTGTLVEFDIIPDRFHRDPKAVNLKIIKQEDKKVD